MSERETSSKQWCCSDITAGEPPADEVLGRVRYALLNQGYDPVKQMVGYLLSGDPTYITEHAGARAAVCEVERDRLLGELVSFYLREMDTEPE